MAVQTQTEVFSNATIDLNDMTITEYRGDSFDCHSLSTLLKRWDGIDGITLTIQKCTPLHSVQGGEPNEP